VIKCALPPSLTYAIVPKKMKKNEKMKK